MQKRIRSIERALKKHVGDEAATEELRIKLAQMQEQHTQSKKTTKEKLLSKKYHMVKFVERQKLTRKIRKYLNIIVLE
jgi:hypothetical protein